MTNSLLMLSGAAVVAFGVSVMAYGLVQAISGVRENGSPRRGSRQMQFAGMAIAVFGGGLMMFSIGQLATNIFGFVLTIQGLAMLIYSPRVEGQRR